MEDLRFQLERTQSELMIACARLRGTEVLARNVEDLRTENDILREQLHRYEDELLSVENRLESFASLHGTDGVPLMEVQRPVAVTSLLEENQKLHNIIEMMQRQRLPGQDGQLMTTGEEHAALEERLEELQSENDVLREELELALPANRVADVGDSTSNLAERLERSERTVMTKSKLVELLTSEVQRLDLELRSARDEVTQVRSVASTENQCVGETCVHMAKVEQLNQQVEHLNKDIENMNVQRQQENQSFIRHREEMERQVQDQRKQVAAVHEQMRTQEENFNAERQESDAQLRRLQVLVAQLNELTQQIKAQKNQLNIQLTQSTLKLNQVTQDRDKLKSALLAKREQYDKLNQEHVTARDEVATLQRRLRLSTAPAAPPQVSAGLGLSNVQMPFKSPSELQPGLAHRGFEPRFPGAQVVRDGIEPDEEEEEIVTFVPDNAPRSQPARGPLSTTRTARECPVCKKKFTMDLAEFYSHCDRCAQMKGYAD